MTFPSGTLPALRLHEPLVPAATQSAPGTETVSELFELVVLPQLEELNRSATTIREYRLHHERWGLFWSTRIDHPRAGAEPAACQVTREDLLAFRRWLPRILAGTSARTLNKHLQTLQMTFAAAAEVGRLSAGIRVKSLPQRKAADKLYFTHEEMTALYRAADAATWPVNWSGTLTPGDFWRTCFSFWFPYGMRTQELVNYEADHRPLLVRQISLHPESPSPNGRATNEHGWFHYVPQKQARFKPEPLVLPLTRITRAHVQMVLQSRSVEPSEPLLPAPRCNRSFYEAWNAILKAAKVKPKPKLDGEDREYEIKHFRKTATTLIDLHRPGMGPVIVGHADRDEPSEVSRVHYNNAELAMVETLSTLPMPEGFEDIFKRGEKQLTLF